MSREVLHFRIVNLELLVVCTSRRVNQMKQLSVIAWFLAICITPLQADLINGLQLYMPLNGNALDSSPNSTHGINSGVTWTNGYNGIANSAGFFDGSGTNIQVLDAPSLDPSTLSLSFWFNMSSLDVARELVNKIGPPGDISYGSEIAKVTDNTGKLFFRVCTDGTLTGLTDLAASTVIQSGTWYHFVGTYDGSQMRLYLNGNLESSTPKTGSVFNSTTPLQLGRYGYFSGWRYHGSIDEVALWNRALTPSEVSQLHLSGVPEPTSTTLILSSSFVLAFWKRRSMVSLVRILLRVSNP